MTTPIATEARRRTYFDLIGDETQAPQEDPYVQLQQALHDPATYYSDIQRVLDHFNDKTQHYEEAQRFYRGDVGEIFATEYIADILMESGDDYRCNFSGRVVEEVYNRLEIQSILPRSPSDPSDISSPYLNDSLDASIGGDMGAATPTLAATPSTDPNIPSAFTDPQDATRLAQSTSPDTEAAARDRILGHPTQSDPETASASLLANSQPTKSTEPAEDPTSIQAAPTLPPDTDVLTAQLQHTWELMWRKNKLGNFFPRWIKQALINGDGYAICWDDGSPQPDPLTGSGLQVQVLDPMTTCVIYDEEHEDVELFGARWFKTADGRKRMNLYYDHWIVKLITKKNSNGDKTTDYIPYVDPLDLVSDDPLDIEQATRIGPPGKRMLTGYPFLNSLVPPDTSVANLYAALSAEQETLGAQALTPDQSTPEQDFQALQNAANPESGTVWPVPNPYHQQPIFHLRTTDDDRYGVPEHRNAYGPQNAINKLIAVQMATSDAQGFPARFALQKSSTIDQNAFDEPDDDELPPDAHSSSIEDRPGVINLLKDIDQLIQLAPADPKGFLDPMLTYIKFMSYVTSTPMSFYDTMGQMPNAATQRENTAPLIKKCEARKRVMTPTIERFTEFMFFLIQPQESVRPVVHVQWAQSQMVDDLPGWQVLAGKLATGVPFFQVMQEAGYTMAQIAGWPTPSTGFTARIALVLQVAQAAQALAPAIAAGVLSDVQASSLIDQMIKDVKSTPTDVSSRVNLSFRA